MVAPDPTSRLSSIEVAASVLGWVDAAVEHGVALRILEAETGYGKTFVAQSLFDQLAARTTPGYWAAGLAPTWPPTALTKVEEDRKTIIPADAMRNPAPGGRLGFAWIGLPLGEVYGAGRIDNAEQFLTQLARIEDDAVTMHAAELRARARRGAVWRTVLTAGKYAAGAVLPGSLLDAMSGGESLRRLVADWRDALHDESEQRRIAARKAVVESLSSIRELALRPGEPLVVVLDDAHTASTEVLELVSLLAGLADVERPDGLERGGEDLALPASGVRPSSLAAGSWHPPSHRVPVLVVATTWKGESRVRTGGLFDRWMALVERALADRPGAVETIALGPIEADAALQRLVASGVPLDKATEMIEHLGQPFGGRGVNALVLSSGRAKVDADLRGGPFSAGLTSEAIAKLPTAPTFHTQQRLEELRRVVDLGEAAHGLLVQFAEWGAIAPRALGDALVATIPDLTIEPLLTLLAGRRMIELPADPDPLALIRIQVDLQAFIAETNHFDEPIRAVARVVRNAVLEMIRDEFGDTSTRVDLQQVRLIVDRAAQLDSAPVAVDDVFDAMSWVLSAAVRDRIAEGDDSMSVLKTAATSGRSRVAANAALRLAEKMENRPDRIRILEPLAEDPRVAWKLADLYEDQGDRIRVLTPFSSAPQVAMRLAGLHHRREDRIRLLEPLSGVTPEVTLMLADVYDGRDDKIRVLSRLSSDPSVALRLADMHPSRDDKIRILEPLSADPRVALRLADVYERRDDRIRVLEPLAVSVPEAALRLAEIVEEREEKIRVLRPLSHDPHVALRLADAYESADDKVRVLTPLADNGYIALRLADMHESRHDKIRFLEAVPNDPTVVMRLADLYEAPHDKIRVLTPVSDDPRVALRLADLCSDREEKVRLLSPLADDPIVALRLADLYEDDADKLRLLAPLSTNPNVASRLSDLYDDPRDRVVVLEPHIARSAAPAIKLANVLRELLPADLTPDTRLEDLEIPAVVQGLVASPAVWTCLVSGARFAQAIQLGSVSGATEVEVGDRGNAALAIRRRTWAMGLASATWAMSGPSPAMWRRVFDIRWEEPWLAPSLTFMFASQVVPHAGVDVNRLKLAEMAGEVFSNRRRAVVLICNTLEMWCNSHHHPVTVGITRADALSSIAFARACTKRIPVAQRSTIRRRLDTLEETLAATRFRGPFVTEGPWSRLCPEFVGRLLTV